MIAVVPRKNVIVIHTDQQRADSLGCMGNRFARTPHLDRLAASGTVFTRHIVSNPVCSPSRASLMTGLYPPGHGVWCTGVPLQRNEHANASPNHTSNLYQPSHPATMADMFSAAGYDTVGFGKFHLTPWMAPEAHGFQETISLWEKGKFDDWHGPYYGFRHVDVLLGHADQPCRVGHYSTWLKREHPEAYRRLASAKPERPCKNIGDLYAIDLPFELHPSMWLADRLCRYIKQERSQDKPFFAYVSFPDPHHPFAPCAGMAREFEDIEVQTPLDPEGDGMRGSPAGKFSQQKLDGVREDELRKAIRYTYAMVYQIDLAVGRILDALAASGLEQGTIVVFTSDHGDFLGDHGRLRKGVAASNALLQVPFVLRAPGSGLPPRVDVPMSNCDVMPTLAALTGMSAPKVVHGEDIVSVQSSGRNRPVFAYGSCGEAESVNHTIYDATHRLTWYPASDFVELFDHRSDPGECHNVAGIAENRTRVETMKQILAERTARFYNPVLGRSGAW